MSSLHDSGYRHLFAAPAMMRDLLTGFVPHEWVGQADFSTLERVNGSYVSDDLRARHDDMVWRIRLCGRWFYVYLLLEFQSYPDRWMALRMHVYTGLLYQDLIARRELGQPGLLPAVLPIVLYNGQRTWRAAEHLDALQEVSPPGLAAYRAQARYLLIDERRFSQAHLPLRNLVAALFRLEQARTPEDYVQVIKHLRQWLAGDEHTRTRRAFTLWLQRRLRAHLPADTIERTLELEEIETMFPDTILKEERRRGVKEGRLEGQHEGLLEGRLQGQHEGRQEATRKALVRLLERRFGAVSPDDEERIAMADYDTLQRWFDRAIDAADVPTVFRGQV